MGSARNEVAELRKICAVCENALLKLLDPETYTQTRRPRISHHEDLSSLATSSGSGCWICAALQYQVRQNPRRKHPAHCGTHFEPEMVLLQPYESGKRGLSGFSISNGEIHEPSLTPETLLKVYLQQDECGGLEIIPNQQITETPNLAFASTWIDECAQTHKDCAPLERKALPTRVIEVGIEGVSEPRLLETGNLLGVYTALSHCWGDHVRRDQLTTTHNKGRRLRALPFQAMAPTFKDAIIATRSLGYRYLWIDVFCIVQDDDQDWARECGLMAPVFANAAVVLAASYASSSDVGFLHARSRSMPSAIFGGFWERFPNGDIQVGPHTLGVEMQAVGRFKDPSWVRIGHDALSRRAWAYQEKALCTRILNFHREQLVFECRHGRRYERRPTYFRKRNPFLSENVLLPLAEYSGPSNWRKAVKNVTSRFITYGNDVLPALAGIASRYQNLTGHTFAAGLWRETFLEDMAWTTSSHGSSNAKYASTSWSPSWSWASCPGSVDFVWDDPMAIRQTEAAAEVLDLASHPENDQNPFGAVSMAQVTLKGFYRRARCYWRRARENESELYLVEAESNCDRPAATFCPDSCEPKSRSLGDAVEVLILIVLRQPYPLGGYDTIALMLKPLDATSTLHRRIGLVRSAYRQVQKGEVDLHDWLRAGEEITVRIV